MYPKFEQNNVKQCWSCKRMNGMIDKKINGYWFVIPYCNVMQMAMVNVFNNPCRAFEPKNIKESEDG